MIDERLRRCCKMRFNKHKDHVRRIQDHLNEYYHSFSDKEALRPFAACRNESEWQSGYQEPKTTAAAILRRLSIVFLYKILQQTPAFVVLSFFYMYIFSIQILWPGTNVI